MRQKAGVIDVVLMVVAILVFVMLIGNMIFGFTGNATKRRAPRDWGSACGTTHDCNLSPDCKSSPNKMWCDYTKCCDSVDSQGYKIRTCYTYFSGCV